MRALLKILSVYIFLFFSCRPKKSSDQYFDKFYENKSKLDSLVRELHNNKSLDSLFQNNPDQGLPEINLSYPKLLDLIRKVGITDASSQPGVCKICPRWYYLKTNWKGEYPIYLIYNSKQDSTESERGFYKIDKYGNETWGLGDNWKMFRFVDTIKDAKF